MLNDNYFVLDTVNEVCSYYHLGEIVTDYDISDPDSMVNELIYEMNKYAGIPIYIVIAEDEISKKLIGR